MKEWCGDIRDVISIGKLVRKSDGPQEGEILKMAKGLSIVNYHTNNPSGE